MGQRWEVKENAEMAGKSDWDGSAIHRESSGFVFVLFFKILFIYF